MGKAQWRSATEREIEAMRALCPSRVRYPVASPPKRFGRSLAAQANTIMPIPVITDKQAECMWRQVVTFRRQIPLSIVEAARAALASLPTKGSTK